MMMMMMMMICLLSDMYSTDSKLLVHPNGINNMYGNSVVRRNATNVANYPFASWINIITALNFGALKNFYMFIHKQKTGPSLKRLQIWRPVSKTQYKLVWERIANFSGTHWHALYKV